jgi:hypothetical protein
MLVLAILSVDQLATWAVESDTGRALIRARARELLGRDIAYGGAEGTLLPPAVVVRELRGMGADEEAPYASRGQQRRIEPGSCTASRSWPRPGTPWISRRPGRCSTSSRGLTSESFGGWSQAPCRARAGRASCYGVSGGRWNRVGMTPLGEIGAGFVPIKPGPPTGR